MSCCKTLVKEPNNPTEQMLFLDSFFLGPLSPVRPPVEKSTKILILARFSGKRLALATHPRGHQLRLTRSPVRTACPGGQRGRPSQGGNGGTLLARPRQSRHNCSRAAKQPAPSARWGEGTQDMCLLWRAGRVLGQQARPWQRPKSQDGRGSEKVNHRGTPK